MYTFNKRDILIERLANNQLLLKSYQESRGKRFEKEIERKVNSHTLKNEIKNLLQDAQRLFLRHTLQLKKTWLKWFTCLVYLLTVKLVIFNLNHKQNINNKTYKLSLNEI